MPGETPPDCAFVLGCLRTWNFARRLSNVSSSSDCELGGASLVAAAADDELLSAAFLVVVCSYSSTVPAPKSASISGEFRSL